MSFDAIVVLPYTRVPRDPGSTGGGYRMSHFTARCVLAGLELYEQGIASRFVLPGERRAPATSDLERSFLLSRGVHPEQILDFPDLNGTLPQLEPVRKLQKAGQLGRVVVVCFAFHAWRVGEYMRMLRIHGEVAEVERTHATFLRTHRNAVRVNRDELVNLPQLAKITRTEQRLSRALLLVDRPFGYLAPASRLYKLLTGPTITDIHHGQPRVSLARLEALALRTKFRQR
jgi:DUF218 domain